MESVFGELLFEGIDDTTNGAVATFWLSRGGNRAVFAVEVLAISGVTVSWTVQHKNIEDVDPEFSDSTSRLFTYRSVSSTGVDFSDIQPTSGGVKELVRYVFKTGTPASLDWVQLRALMPSWQVT